MSAKRVVLAEYFTVEDRTLLFIVRDDFAEPEVIEIPVGTEAIQEFVKKHFQAEKNSDGKVVKTTGKKLENLDEATYQLFLAPFVSPLVSRLPNGDLMTEEGDIIWLVPHNFLHYLPLHAVKIDDRRYLIERNPVCYTPSASVMKYCHAKRKERREKALILADSRGDRVFTQVQGVAIKELFQPNAELYIGPTTTKDLLKQKLKESKAEIDILHLACHGKFDTAEALKSGIDLAGEEILTAEEIFNLEMNADLVSLSACESGINDNKPGDELIGLTRALIYAGTPSVLVSLWSVDQISTSILMSIFYQKLKAGINKVEALRKAQLELRTMTVQQVIDYCLKAKEYVNSSLTGSNGQKAERALDRYVAIMQYNAGDYEGAAKNYTQLLKGADLEDEERKEIESELRDCEDMFVLQDKNYQRFIYKRLYNWAAFVLVGDWR